MLGGGAVRTAGGLGPSVGLPPDPRASCIPNGRPLPHIPAANSSDSDPVLLTLLRTVEADTFLCPVAESRDYPGREAGLASRANPTRLIQLLTALLRGKERAMWVSGPFLLRIHCCLHGVGVGRRHHIPCNLKETRYGNSEKSGFHCPCSTVEEALFDTQCLVWEMEPGRIPSCSSSLAGTDTHRALP